MMQAVLDAARQAEQRTTEDENALARDWQALAEQIARSEMGDDVEEVDPDDAIELMEQGEWNADDLQTAVDHEKQRQAQLRILATEPEARAVLDKAQAEWHGARDRLQSEVKRLNEEAERAKLNLSKATNGMNRIGEARRRLGKLDRRPAAEPQPQTTREFLTTGESYPLPNIGSGQKLSPR